MLATGAATDHTLLKQVKKVLRLVPLRILRDRAKERLPHAVSLMREEKKNCPKWHQTLAIRQSTPTGHPSHQTHHDAFVNTCSCIRKKMLEISAPFAPSTRSLASPTASAARSTTSTTSCYPRWPSGIPPAPHDQSQPQGPAGHSSSSAILTKGGNYPPIAASPLPLLLKLYPPLTPDTHVTCFRTKTGFGDRSRQPSRGAVGSAADDGMGEAANPIFKALEKVRREKEAERYEQKREQQR